MVGLMPVVLFLAIFVGIGMTARAYDRRLRQRLLLVVAALVALLYAAGSR